MFREGNLFKTRFDLGLFNLNEYPLEIRIFVKELVLLFNGCNLKLGILAKTLG